MSNTSAQDTPSQSPPTPAGVTLAEWRKRLQAFCDLPCDGGESESYRTPYSRPFLKGGVLYATDAKIAIAVSGFAGEPDDAPPGRVRYPGVEKVVEPYQQMALKWEPLPEVAYCGICDGTCVVNATECEDCDGTGTTQCPHCDQDMDCEECDGGMIGQSRCEECKAVDMGDGKEWAAYMVRAIAATEKEWGGKPMIARIPSSVKRSEFVLAFAAGPNHEAFGVAMMKTKVAK